MSGMNMRGSTGMDVIMLTMLVRRRNHMGSCATGKIRLGVLDRR